MRKLHCAGEENLCSKRTCLLQPKPVWRCVSEQFVICKICFSIQEEDKDELIRRLMAENQQLKRDNEKLKEENSHLKDKTTRLESDVAHNYWAACELEVLMNRKTKIIDLSITIAYHCTCTNF